MVYHTQLEPIVLKAYGREVQEMVKQARNLPNREERTAMAYRIIEVMKILTQQPRVNAEEEAKLWNHLAQMANYDLDIDYPCTIEPHVEQQKPPRLPYSQHNVRLRHYGHLLQTIVQELAQEPDAQRRRTIIASVASRMKRNLAEERGDVADVRRLAHDISYFTNGSVTPQEVEEALGNFR